MNTSNSSGDEIKVLKQQIAELRKSEAFFRAITQNSSDLVIVVNKKAEITYVNSVIEQHLGYHPEELIGKSGFDYIIPTDIPRALLDFGKSLLTKKIKISNTFEVRHKDGSTRILEGIGMNLLHNGVVKGFVMNVHDVTDRRKAETELDSYRQHLEELVEKRTAEISLINARLSSELSERKAVEKALKESEEKYRDFIENAPIGVGIVDMSGKVLYINKRIEEMMGWSRKEVIGKYGFGLGSFDDESRRRLFERFTARTKGDMPRLFEIPIARKDKSPVWVEVITTILKKDDVPVGAQMVFVNITERKEAEKTLRKSEDRFRTLIQRSSDVITILDTEGRMTYNSPSAEVIFGYPLETLTGKSFQELVYPDDYDLVRLQFISLIDKTNHGNTTEFRGLKGDGTWRTFETMGKNLIDYEGINGVVFITRDITERKQAEEERRILLERLHRVEKIESLGTLAGGVAHDLNNVLGVLVGYTQLMLTKMDEDNPLKKYLHNILKSSEKGTAIIQDMLTMTRRGVNISTEVVNLNNILSDFFQTPEFDRIQSYHPNVTFNKVPADHLLNIKGMPVHLGKVLMNLISNATEAITGTGEVTITTGNCYLDKPLSGCVEVRKGDYVTLTVCDNGQGISSSDIGRIFEPFYTKKVMGRSGTGLGLAVVWGTIKDHEGYIDVQSEPGKGSTFTIYFPATQEIVNSKRQKNISPDSYMGSGESVLVIDDIHDQREVATSMLSKLGYQVKAMASGEDAVDYMNNQSTDVLVLDMLMEPGIDGLETYKRILKKHPKQKAIIVSGFSETARVKQAMKLGAGAYVQKPYLLENIGMALRKVLSESSQQTEYGQETVT